MTTAKRQPTKERCIYKNLSTGKYDVKFNYKVYNPRTGSNDYKSKWRSGFRTMAEAKAELLKMQTGGVKRDEAITLRGAYDLWKLKAEGVKGYSPVTVKNTETYMRMIGQFLDLDMRVKDINDDVYMKFCRDIKQYGYAGETLHNLNGCLRKLINLCYRKRLISENPLDFIDNMTSEYKDKDSYRLVTKAEYDAMDEWLRVNPFVRLGVDEHKKHRVGITLLYYTGMRIGELLALTADDVRDGYVYITKAYVSEFKLVKSPKNLKHRKVPVPAFVSELVAEYVAEFGLQSDDMLLGVTRGAVDSTLKTMCRALGIESVSCHCFRHTYITNLLRAGVPIGIVEKVSGDTQGTILKRYSNYFDTDEGMVVTAMESL